jgi:hypothetical protein
VQRLKTSQALCPYYSDIAETSTSIGGVGMLWSLTENATPDTAALEPAHTLIDAPTLPQKRFEDIWCAL